MHGEGTDRRDGKSDGDSRAERRPRGEAEREEREGGRRTRGDDVGPNADGAELNGEHLREGVDGRLGRRDVRLVRDT